MTPPEGDDPFDVTDETYEAPARLDQWQPYEHKVRVGLMWACGLGLLVLVAVQVWLAFEVDPDQYQVVSAPMAGVSTVFSAVLGAAAIYYFTRRD